MKTCKDCEHSVFHWGQANVDPIYDTDHVYIDGEMTRVQGEPKDGEFEVVHRYVARCNALTFEVLPDVFIAWNIQNPLLCPSWRERKDG